MRERTNISLKKTYAAALIILVSLAWINSSFPQGFSNGTIDIIFKPKNNMTQFAVWVEDENGEYVGTVYLSDFIGRRGGGNRTADPDIDSYDGNRLSALPVWAYKRDVVDTTFGIENYYPPASTQPSYPQDIDAVSRATPNTNMQRKTWQLSRLPYGRYICRIEANQSFNFNKYYDYSWYRGQPSVVWSTTVVVGAAADSSVVLNYQGYGSPNGSDGKINPPDYTITTAADLLVDLGGYKFKVVYTPGIVSVRDDFDGSTPVRFFNLGQNSPNPFNSSTLISYSLPVPAFIILKIYDIMGKEIQTLVEKFQAAGDYSVRFDTNVLSSGVYLYKLQIGNGFVKTKKMLLMR